MGLRRGAAAAEEEAKKSRTNFGRAEYFRLKDGESITFRLIDGPDDWIFTNQHGFVPTKGAPPDADEKTKANWPKRMGAVCRKDKAFDGKYADCYIDTMIDERSGKSFKAPVRLWARLLIRQPVAGTEQMVADGLIQPHQVGKTVGFQDEIVEEAETDKEGKETGKTIRHPKIVVANLSLDNFFGALQGYADFYAEEGGILNRDITVARKGENTDTEYNFAPRGVTPGFDLADPATKARYEEFAGQAHLSVAQLEEMIEGLASDDYYARYFDPTKPFPKSKNRGKDDDAGAPASQQTKPVETEATQEALEAMRARVRGGNANPAGETSQAAGSMASDTVGAVNFSSAP
jgi:hypothetical protein